jgi:hypothetical protein
VREVGGELFERIDGFGHGDRGCGLTRRRRGW